MTWSVARQAPSNIGTFVPATKVARLERHNFICRATFVAFVAFGVNAPLELGEPHQLPLDDISKERLTVTLVDANHCPGAVMFLFEGYFGSILYTGDFRYTPSMLREPCLRTNATIDILYLDNTNCDPNRTLPTRQRATQQIKEIIRSHPNHEVVIGLYALGKESLLVELAMEFKTWIEVSFERMETLKALDLPNVFTTETGAGRIRVVDQSAVVFAAVQRWNKEKPTLAIIPTSRLPVYCHPNIHFVPYSDHSSYQELEDFVSALKPTSIIPIVGNYVPESISTLLPRQKRHEILVPESVQRYMSRQPANTLSLSAYTALHHRHCRPFTPRGVIFDSPGSGSSKSLEESWEGQIPEQGGFEEEMDTESSEKESDCICMDLNKELTPNKHPREARDMWSINIIERVSEELMSAETEPLSEFMNINFPPVELLKHTKSCPTPQTPPRTVKKPFMTNAKIISETVMSEIPNYQPKRHENSECSHSLSDTDSICQHNGQEIDQGDEIMSNCYCTSQHNGCGDDQNDNVTQLQENSDGSSCTSSSSQSEVQQAYMEELEDSILDDLCFSDEDLQVCGLLQENLVKQVCLCPLRRMPEP